MDTINDSGEGRRFGEIAVRRGYIDRGVLDGVLGVQESMRQRSPRDVPLIGDLLAIQGYLGQDRIDSIARQQGVEIRIGDYVLHERIGRGAQSVVYRGSSAGRPDSQYAVKRTELTVLGKDTSARNEAALLSRLRHPHIVKIHDVLERPPYSYLVMEYCDRTLESDIETRSLSQGDIADIGADVASALGYIHSEGIIHRDVKPDNILRGARGVVLSDFSIARPMDVSQCETDGVPESRTNTSPCGILGTLCYLSPEQVLSRRLDNRTDVYSLGAVLYDMLTGSPPFKDGSELASLMRTVSERPRPPSTIVRPDRGLEDICLTALDKYPGGRFQTAGEMERELRKAADRISRRGPDLPDRIAVYEGPQYIAGMRELLPWEVPEEGDELSDPEPNHKIVVGRPGDTDDMDAGVLIATIHARGPNGTFVEEGASQAL